MYASKRIHNGCLVQIENSVTPDTYNSYPGDGIFNPYLTTIKDSYSLVHYSQTLRETEFRFEPRHEKTCLQGLRPGKTQTGLLFVHGRNRFSHDVAH